MEHVFGNELAQKKGLVDCHSVEEFEGMMAEVSGMTPFVVLKSLDCRPIGRGPGVMLRRL